MGSRDISVFAADSTVDSATLMSPVIKLLAFYNYRTRGLADRSLSFCLWVMSLIEQLTQRSDLGLGWAHRGRLEVPCWEVQEVDWDSARLYKVCALCQSTPNYHSQQGLENTSLLFQKLCAAR